VTLWESAAAIAGHVWTEPSGTHDLLAEEDTLLFVTSPNGIRVIE
jgi:hypothetical protein